MKNSNKFFLQVIVILFLTGMFILSGTAESKTDEAGMELSRFKMRESDEDGIAWQLEGDTAQSRGQRVKIHDLDLTIYPEDSSPVNVTSPYCRYNQNNEDLQSSDTIRVTNEAFILKGKDYFILLEEQKMHIENHAVMIIKNVDTLTNDEE